MTERSAEKDKLESAYEHVLRFWFPVDAENYQKIQDGLREGVYERDRDALVAHIKADFSLYMYCLRELSQSVDTQAQDRGRDQRSTPSQIIRKAEVTELRKIFDRPRSEISAHSYSSLTPLQAQRLQESMMSATTAECMAEKQQVDPKVAYSCGLLRQLGMTLIAWNYPKVYHRAVEHIKEGADESTLDESLQRVLGFSPPLLGLRFAYEWNLAPEILQAMDPEGRARDVLGSPRTAREGDIAVAQTGRRLAKICQVGEALARAQNAEYYPTARGDFEHAEKEIQQALGTKGMDLIFQRLKENCQLYQQYAPEVFNLPTQGALKQIKGKIQQFFGWQDVMKGNAYLRSCPPEIQKAIAPIYSELKPGQVAQDTLRKLFFEIIPNAGFRNGAVFSFDPTRMRLVPMVVIGKIDKRLLQSVDFVLIMETANPVALAFDCATPVRGEDYRGDGKKVVYTAASFGGTMKAGVIYLEADQAFAKKHGENFNSIFKAVRQALNDVLGLES